MTSKERTVWPARLTTWILLQRGLLIAFIARRRFRPLKEMTAAAAADPRRNEIQEDTLRGWRVARQGCKHSGRLPWLGKRWSQESQDSSYSCRVKHVRQSVYSPKSRRSLYRRAAYSTMLPYRVLSTPREDWRRCFSGQKGANLSQIQVPSVTR